MRTLQNYQAVAAIKLWLEGLNHWTENDILLGITLDAEEALRAFREEIECL